MLRKEVLILDCPEIQCPPVLRIVFWELCGAFRRRNYTVRIVETIQEIHEDAIVFMGDFIHVKNPCLLLSTIARNAIYVGWYWHQQDTSSLPYFLHVYENVLSQTLSPDKQQVVEFMRQHVSCPLLLRTDENPDQIGTYSRQNQHDYCFMGGRMCEWMVPSDRFQGVYHGVHDTRQYLPYEERRSLYLSSTFALGFQTEENIKNGHVSQRIFEAMSYGCIVLSNSLHASIQTEGIVEYVEDKGSLERRMDFFLQNPHYIQQKQQRGYEFARKYGTNEYSISVLLETMEKNFKKK
jgi:spore maturation protein CgeB